MTTAKRIGRRWAGGLAAIAVAAASLAAASGPPAATQPAPALQVWVVDAVTNVLRTAQPPKGAQAAIHLDAAANEWESAQVAIRSPIPVKLTARVWSDIAYPHYANLQPTRLRWVGYVTADRSTVDEGWPKDPQAPLAKPGEPMPDPLLEEASVDLPANQTGALWVDVWVPAGVPADKYTATIAIRAGEQAILVPVELQVYAVELPKKQTLKVLQWFYPKELARVMKVPLWSDDYWRLLGGVAHNMHQHRQNVFSAELDTLLELHGDETNWTIDFTLFDRFVQTFISNGVSDGIFGMSLASRNQWEAKDFMARNFRLVRPDGSRGQLPGEGVKAPSKEFEAFPAKFLPLLEAHLKEKGWLGIYLQSLSDEPIAVNAEAYKEIAAVCRKYAPGIRRCDAVRTDSPIDGALDVYAPILFNGDTNWDFYSRKIAQGAEVWFYTCERPRGAYLNRFIDHPLIKTRLLHWESFALKAPGYLHWGYNSWTGDPFKQVHMGGPLGDCFIVYPGKGTVWDSIRHEAMRDGVEDYELLSLLAKSDPKRAQAICDEMIQSKTEYVRDPGRFLAIRRELLESAQRK